MIYISIPLGLPMFGEATKELLCYPKEATGHVDFKNIDAYFPGGGFQMDSETGDSLDFLTFIGEYFNSCKDTKEVQPSVRLIESNTYGPLVFQNDQGYMHFWCESIFTIYELHEWFLKYQLNKD